MKNFVSDFVSNGFSKTDVCAYPQNSIDVIANIMKEINIKSMPVFESPWNKKIIGIIEYDSIKEFV